MKSSHMLLLAIFAAYSNFSVAQNYYWVDYCINGEDNFSQTLRCLYEQEEILSINNGVQTISWFGGRLIYIDTYDGNPAQDFVSREPDLTELQKSAINQETAEHFALLEVTYLQQLTQPTFAFNCHGWGLGYNLWINNTPAAVYYNEKYTQVYTFAETHSAAHNKSLTSVDHSSKTLIMYVTIPEGCEGAGQVFPANTYNGKYGPAGRYLSAADLPERVYGSAGNEIWYRRN